MSEITEIKTLNGYPLADTKARTDIATLSEEIDEIKESGGGGAGLAEEILRVQNIKENLQVDEVLVGYGIPYTKVLTTAAVGYKLYKYNVEKLPSVIVTGYSIFGNHVYAFFNAAGTYVSGQQSANEGTTLTDEVVEVPAGAVWLYVQQVENSAVGAHVDFTDSARLVKIETDMEGVKAENSMRETVVGNPIATLYPAANMQMDVSVESLTGGTVHTVGKNFIAYPYEVQQTLVKNGLTFTVNADGSVKIKGTSTAATWFSAAQNVRFPLPVGRFRLTGGLSGDVSLYIPCFNLDGTQADVNGQGNYYVFDRGAGATYVVTQPVEAFLQIQVVANATVDATVYPMMTLESEADGEWAAYNGNKASYASGVVCSLTSVPGINHVFATDCSTVKVSYGASLVERIRQIEDAVYGEYVLPDYYHAGNYIGSKIDLINSMSRSAHDAFVFITDAHTDWKNAGMAFPLLRYIRDNTHVSRLFEGGDTKDGGDAVRAEKYRDAFGREIHFVMGNHEWMSADVDGLTLYYDFDALRNDQHGNAERHYYYVDNVQQKIRYIVLSAHAEGDGTSAGTGFEAEQLSWFTDDALKVQAGWTIIIFAHPFVDISLSDALTWRSAAVPFVTAIDEYDGPGEIACLIQGECHRDRISATPGGVPLVVTTCDKYMPWVTSSGQDINTTREPGTITEGAFDVVIVNKTARKLSFVRIGAPALDGVGNNPGNPVEIREVTY